MSRAANYASTIAIVLIVGGFGALGAAAGLRVAIGTSTQVLDCSMRACVPLVREYNILFWNLLTGGVLAMVCGGIAQWWISSQLGSPADE